jgi:tetratricopeptide (TPR) repeat protein
MRWIDLKLAASEIKQAVTDARAEEKPSPFFFVVGAGISSPPIPLASEIQEHCKELAAGRGRSDTLDSTSPADQYSHWFSEAFPQSAQRQRYLRELIQKQFISRANFRLAHLMLDRTVASLVVTTNFDDFLSRALSLFGTAHIVCDHPKTVERIDPQSDDIQIVHLHGSYWFYDCCNLTGEMARRAQPSTTSSKTMAQLLDTVFWSHSPLVLGYSGWDGDVFMSALKRRLTSGLATNLYWFCYDRASARRLQDALKDFDTESVVLVTPPERKAAGPRDQKALSPGLTQEVDAREPALPATAVLDELIQAFKLEPPKLTLDPLGFFAKQLRDALLGDPNELANDVYSIQSVIDRVERANQLQAAKPKNAIETALEEMRDARRRSDFGGAVRTVKALPLDELKEDQLREIFTVMMDAGRGLEDVSPENLESYSLAASIGDRLIHADGTAAPEVLNGIALALRFTALALERLDRATEALPVFDEVVQRFGDTQELWLRTQAAIALRSKGVTLAKLWRQQEAIAVFDEVVSRFGKAQELGIREQTAMALRSRALALATLGRHEESMRSFDEVVGQFGNAPEVALRAQAAMAMVDLGRVLGRRAHNEDAIVVFDSVDAQFGSDAKVAIQAQVATALNQKGSILRLLERPEQAIAVFDNVLLRFGNAAEAGIREEAAQALLSKGATLDGLNRHAEAVNVYHELIERFGGATENVFRDLVGDAEFFKSHAADGGDASAAKPGS